MLIVIGCKTDNDDNEVNLPSSYHSENRNMTYLFRLTDDEPHQVKGE